MCNLRLRLALAILSLIATGLAADPMPPLAHRLAVELDPERGTIEGTDEITLPEARPSWDFILHRGLEPRVLSGTARLARVGREGHLEQFRLYTGGATEVTLAYGGEIRHRLAERHEGMGRVREDAPGIIDLQGVVLTGWSGWYPSVPGLLETVALAVRLPAGWLAVSQGAGPTTVADDRGAHVGWRETRPQDAIYLIAAPFEAYRRPTSHGEAQVYLRRPDAALAARYLAATERFLALYSRLIGPYPYAKFALVENFWDTGFGMPSFTLLGPRVIRLPFILDTSYPHEILHNWWGNGVFVDYESGNWSEGLTAYLADHLLAEERGEGADYRRASLEAYADYVRAGEDFPLRDFRGRHGSASQAIGYGKTAMVFHMLRGELGDPAFVAGLRLFYRDNLFRVAGFDDLRQAFEQASGDHLRDFFRQWTERTGAPELALDGVAVETTGDGYLLRGRLEQVQADPPFALEVPLAVQLADGGVREERVRLDGRTAAFAVALPVAPVRVAVDPRFDLFRTLAPGESPVTLSDLFGAASGLILLPTDAPAPLAAGYRRLAEAWQAGAPGWTIARDAEVQALPAAGSVWLLGWDNRFLSELAPALPSRLDTTRRRLALPEGEYAGDAFSLALALGQGDRVLGWAAAADPQALAGLARKLPHYGKFSYLVFAGAAPDNRVKGRWPAGDSPLRRVLGERATDPGQFTPPPRTPLTAVID